MSYPQHFESLCFRSMASNSLNIFARLFVGTFVVFPILIHFSYTAHMFLALSLPRPYLPYHIYPFPLLLSFPVSLFSRLARWIFTHVVYL